MSTRKCLISYKVKSIQQRQLQEWDWEDSILIWFFPRSSLFLIIIFLLSIRLDTERSWCSQRTSQIRENFSEVEHFDEKESPAVSVSSRTGSLVYVNEKHLVVPKVTSHSSLGDRERNTEPEKPLLRTRSTPKLSKSGPTIRARKGIHYFRNDLRKNYNMNVELTSRSEIQNIIFLFH